ALGCVVADLRHDFVRTLNRPLDAVDMAEFHAVLAAQEAEGRRLIGAEKITLTRVRAEFSADMQFVGQTHLLRVTLPSATPSRETLQSLFEAAYHARFRVDLPTIRANLVNLNCSVIGERPALDLSRLIDPDGRKLLAERIRLPQGYTVAWGGAFENMERANARLLVVVPITLGLVFFLLFWAFHSLRYASLIILNLPFAL
ncbi:MAG TPA: efflux RND transporter permease subunit, partial [Tabrizicola sp.]|nr:efflux RND transporter permease subunit [Tabrizicola sp.]